MWRAPVGDGAKRKRGRAASVPARHADRRACFHSGRAPQHHRAGRRARLRRDPDLSPEPADVAPDGVRRRRLRRLQGGDGRLAHLLGGHPRRLPDQRRQQGARGPRQVAGVAEAGAAGGRRHRRRRRGPPRGSSQGRASQALREAGGQGDQGGAGELGSLSASCSRTPPAPTARSGRTSTSSPSWSRPPAAASGWGPASTAVTCSRRGSTSRPPRRARRWSPSTTRRSGPSGFAACT